MLEAAIRLLDAEGVQALTMRRLASDLGVSAMAPYRHVGSKDELLMVLLDRLAARLVYPPRPPDPKGAMLVLWSAIYDSLAEHSWIPEVLARRRLMAPSVLDAVEEIHAALRAAGLSIEAAVRAYRLMWNFTLGSLLVRAGAGSQVASQQRELRGTPDPGAIRRSRRPRPRGRRHMTGTPTAMTSGRSSTRCWRMSAVVSLSGRRWRAQTAVGSGVPRPGRDGYEIVGSAADSDG